MDYTLLCGLALLFFAVVIADLAGHGILKIRRSIQEWIFFSLLILACGSSGFFGVKAFIDSNERNDGALYLSYRYLLDDDIPNALSSMKRAGAGSEYQAPVIELLSLCKTQDYVSAYFRSEQIMNEGNVKGELLESVKALNKMSAAMLNIAVGEAADQEITGQGALSQSAAGQGAPSQSAAGQQIPSQEAASQQVASQQVVSQKAASQGVTGQNVTSQKLDNQKTSFQKVAFQKVAFQKVSSQAPLTDDAINDSVAFVEQEILRCFNAQRFNNSDKLEDTYLLDKQIRSGAIGELSIEEVLAVVEKYEGDSEILKPAIRYAAGIRNYEKAVELAEKLLKDKRSVENLVIYTDIIAQGVSDGYTINKEDMEKQKILSQAEVLERRAAEYFEMDEKREELLNRANDLQRRAENLEIYRVINYVQAKKPLLFDTSGLYDIQLAKLYLAADEREKAREIIYDIVDNSPVISETSPIKEPLKEVIDAYNQSTADEVSPLLQSAVQDMISAESQDIIQMNEATINGRLANYITSTLKYDKIGIFISKVDTQKYPEITAFLNINGEKNGVLGLASEFKEKDFELIDTQYQITKFTIDSEAAKTDVNISIVLDRSGSMNGTPIADALTATNACINKMDAKNQYLSIVAYSSDASVITARTNSEAALRNGSNSIVSGGGTNISAGIESGISSLNGSTGAKAIILLTDGQDGNSQEAMDEAINRAIKNDVAIFTVGLGDINSEYLRAIAQRTGGKFILASNSTELEDIYLTLQKYIVNNYCVKYTVSANPESDPRNLTVGIPEYQVSGDKDYTISDESGEEAEQATGIHAVDEDTIAVSSVTPNSLSAADILKGVEITIKGTGLSEDAVVSIGKLKLEGLKATGDSAFSGKLKGDLSAGAYQVKAAAGDGRIVIKKDAFHVFRAGTTTRVRLGSATITADAIGQTGDRSFVASGNVLINGFIHCDTSLTITANDLPENFVISPGGTSYLGNSGVFSGKGRLYISYAQVSSNGIAGKTFAKLALGGKNYIVEDGEFAIGVNGTDTDFDMSLHNFDIQIPMMSTIEVAKMKLYSDRIQITIDELNPADIIESVTDGIKGSVVTTQKEEKAVKGKKAAKESNKTAKRSEAFVFKPSEAIGGSMDVAVTANDIIIGLTLSLESENSIQFGSIGLDSAELKINSLDPSKEYWKLGGEIDFSKIVKGFGGVGISGLNGHIASYYWCFDEIEITADLYPGIPIYNAVYIDKMGLNLDGASTLLLKSPYISDETKKVLFADSNLEAVQAEDVILSGLVGADANLFKTFKLKVPKDFTKWGTLGEIDGKISYNFCDVQFQIAADLKVLKQKMANASIGFGKSGLNVAAGANLDLSMLDCELGGNIDLGLNTTWKMLTLSLETDGHIDCGFMNVHYKGDAGLKFIAEYDGSYFAVELSQANKVSKYWYDSDGKPLFWNRFHTSTYFE